MKNGIIIGLLVVIAALAFNFLEPADFDTESPQLDMTHIDRTDADEVATMFKVAYLHKDLEAISTFIPPQATAQIEDLMDNRENSEIYRLLYDSPEQGWQHVTSMNSETINARLDGDERLYPLKAMESEMFVLTLAPEEDGKWYVQDVHSPDLLSFESLALAD